MVELERNGKLSLEEMTPVLAPSEKWCVKDLGIDANHSINLTIRQSRCADNHVIITQIVSFASFMDNLS